MKSTRLLAVMLVGALASISGVAQSLGRAGIAAPIKPIKTHAESRTVGSSRNGGRRTSNRAHQRLALKKRNQARHRRACRSS